MMGWKVGCSNWREKREDEYFVLRGVRYEQEARAVWGIYLYGCMPISLSLQVALVLVAYGVGSTSNKDVFSAETLVGFLGEFNFMFYRRY